MTSGLAINVGRIELDVLQRGFWQREGVERMRHRVIGKAW